MTSVHNMEVLAIRAPTSESVYSQECFQKFKDFHSGKRAFKSPDSREKALAMNISKRDFLDFRKLLDRDYEEKDR